MHKSLLYEIEERKNINDIAVLTDIVSMLLDNIKETNVEFYNHIENLLYETIHGKKLTKELAEKIVYCMKPYGEHWTIEQTTQVMQQAGYNYRSEDFYIVMNMAYNDFYNMFGDDVSKYIQYSKLFIDDEDAEDDKVYNYFTKI